MTSLYKIILFFPILTIIGCSGSGSSSSTVTSNGAVETCFDVEVKNAGNSQTQNICTTVENGGYNGLGVARFIRFSVSSPNTSVSVRATRTSGLNPADPDIYLFKNGAIINYAETTQSNTEYLTANLGIGDYVVEINEYGYWSSSDKPIVNSTLTQKTSEPVLFQATSPSTNCNDVSGSSTVTGTITFDRVPHLGNALDYRVASITQEPIQQAVVEVICGNGTYGTSVRTDQNGFYSISYPHNTSSFIRVNAQMLSASWDFSVVDNTISNKPIYRKDNNVVLTTGPVDNHDFNAESGWGGASYTGTRFAAPFAILDSVRKAKDKIINSDINPVVFPALKINWSPSNSSLTINTSFYDGTEIFLLGAENSDTDEYDEHVIIHEWGHYFEDKFSRTDSIGGPHSGGDIIDIRVAFGEGFGNAFSSIVLDDPNYIDTSGPQQSVGFSINMENNNCTNAGWYSECSVQSTLYDIFDTTNDGADNISLGFTPIYEVLVGSQKTTAAFTSIFSFTKVFKDENPASANVLDSILSTQNIDSVMDIYGSSQMTSNPGVTDQLPVYGAY
ncbi:MAG: hypothetical protein OQK98_13415 [Gammaproteobacteria bacterium]|nr:hypothetical protein [Gammaproteobacteria bacterium]